MLALTNARLVDGTAQEPIDRATVLIEENRILDAGSHVRYGESAQVIDLQGLVLMPGLVDLHVHCGGIVKLKPGEPHFVDMELSDKYADAREHSIANGVTTLRSCGDFFPDIVQVRDELSSKKLAGPRFFVTGVQFTAPGGHPAYTIMGGDPYIVENAIILAHDPVKAREGVRAMIDGGVDFIKAQLSSFDAWNYPRKVPKLSLDVLEAIIDESHKLGHRAIVHCETPQDALEALKRGADSLEHLVAVSADSADLPDELVDLLLQTKAHVVPTLVVTKLYTDRTPGPKRYTELRDNIGVLYRAGVNISTGTDAGAPDIQFGEAVHDEMQLMVDAGMSTMDTIVASTAKAAANLGRQDELGTIEKGKLADLIAVEGNPLEDIANTRNVKLVVKDGDILVNRLA
jgi:imidazolonepropionase-like amidohydrolase